MDDLRRRFAGLDRLRAPELWDEIELRAAVLGSAEHVAPVPVPIPVPSTGFSGRTAVVLLVGAALLVGMLAGVIIVGSALVKLPAILPSPSTNPVTSPAPSALPTPEIATGRIVYQRHTRIANGQEGGCVTPSAAGCTQWSTVFVANDDGREPRELTPGAWDAEPVALSPDGRQLIVRVMGLARGEDHHYLSDLSGSGLELLDTGCLAPCIGDSGFAFSPDGERLAFIRSYGTGEPIVQITESVLAIMDWVTGEAVELDSTRAHPSADFCPEGCPVGHNESPRWSPDGAHLLFTRSGLAGPADPNEFIGTLTFIVDDDGGNLRELAPLELFARDAHWSPDGARIVFTSAIEGSTEDRAFYQQNDIYTVRPDGTQLTRLTRDSEGPIEAYASVGAVRPSWTRDGRIVFVVLPRGGPDAGQVWTIDADGSDARALVPADASTLTGIGCVTCPYPPDELADVGLNVAGGGNAIWQARP